MNLTPKTAFVAIVGRPNVGKSTLLNRILGEKIAIVSNKPQTTRTRITGILTKNETQYVFLDTPGMHKPKTKLGEVMVKEVSQAIGDVDCALLLCEADTSIHPADRELLERFDRDGTPVILVINKTDITKKDLILAAIQAYTSEFEFASVVPMSALTGDGADIIFEELEQFVHEGDWFFPSDYVTDQPERQIAAEVIREKLLRLLSEEIPHGTAVVIEGFKDIRGHLLDIRAEIFCEKESHKRIIIGKNGSMLKKIGSYAREDLESFFGVKVNLNLWVKVKENWRDSDVMITNFGFNNKDE